MGELNKVVPVNKMIRIANIVPTSTDRKGSELTIYVLLEDFIRSEKGDSKRRVRNESGMGTCTPP